LYQVRKNKYGPTSFFQLTNTDLSNMVDGSKVASFIENIIKTVRGCKDLLGLTALKHILVHLVVADATYIIQNVIRKGSCRSAGFCERKLVRSVVLLVNFTPFLQQNYNASTGTGNLQNAVKNMLRPGLQLQLIRTLFPL